MSQLCGCLGSTKQDPRTQVPAHPEAGFMPRGEIQNQPPQYDSVDAGYAPVVPLPRYTPRPLSLHEKTLGLTERQRTEGSDEKSRRGIESEEALQSQSTGSSSATVTASNTVVDDASSAFSFPSSFGHTSTETRDTPPPPYSSCASSFYARSRASSIRSHWRSESPSSYSMNEPNEQRSEGIVSTPMILGIDMVMAPPAAHVHVFHQHPHRLHSGHQGHHEAHPNNFRRSLDSHFSPHETLHRTHPHHHPHDLYGSHQGHHEVHSHDVRRPTDSHFSSHETIHRNSHHHPHPHPRPTRQLLSRHSSHGQRRLSWESQ